MAGLLRLPPGSDFTGLFWGDEGCQSVIALLQILLDISALVAAGGSVVIATATDVLAAVDLLNNQAALRRAGGRTRSGWRTSRSSTATGCCRWRPA